jgi:hypothetical protein
MCPSGVKEVFSFKKNVTHKSATESSCIFLTYGCIVCMPEHVCLIRETMQDTSIDVIK